MRSSSYSANDTTQWIRYTQRFNYDLGTSQNDLTLNGPGGTAASVASGTLPYEPPAFGGDRISIGRQFASAYNIDHKGTGSGNVQSQAYNAGPSTTWEVAGAPALGPDHVLTPGAGGNYDVSNGDIVEITIGKRPDGTLDIYWNAPLIKGSTPSHFVSTLGTDNPDWFFYQLEIRGRGAGAALNSEQDLLLFEYGNDWGDLGGGVWGVLSEVEVVQEAVIPEPASLVLAGCCGTLLFARRRRE